MRDYQKLYSNYLAAGFSPELAHMIVDMIKDRDNMIEHMHSMECRDWERARRSSNQYAKLLEMLLVKYRIRELDSMLLFGKLRTIEIIQREQLLNTGSREKSILLQSILKHFCSLSDEQVLTVEQILDPPQREGGEELDSVIKI